MSGRDLLHKPIIVLPDDNVKADKSDLPAPARDKLGLKTRGRDLGGTQDPASRIAPQRPSKSDGKPAAGAASPATQKPAFQAAYFNANVDATTTVNQRARSM